MLTNCILIFEEMAREQGLTLTEARSVLEHDAQMVIDGSVWSKWRNGKRTPPAKVVRLINRYIAGAVLGNLGLEADEEVAVLLADAFSPPPHQ